MKWGVASAGVRATPCPSPPRLPHHASLAPQGSLGSTLTRKVPSLPQAPRRVIQQNVPRRKKEPGSHRRRSCGGAQLPRCSRPLRSGTRLSSVGQRCLMRLRSRNVKGRQRGTTTRKADRAAGTGSEVSGTRTRASRFSSPRQIGFASLRMETFFPALLGTQFPGI